MSRTIWQASLAMAAAIGLLWQLFPLPDARARLDKIPTRGYGFASWVRPLQPEEKQILAKAGVFRREYRFQGERFTLTVIDGTHDRHAVHDPMYCIRGAGWRVVSRNPFPIPKGMAEWLNLRRGNERAEALVWFSDGVRRFYSPMRYWWETAWRRLTLGGSEPEPVLVRVQTAGGGTIHWRELIEQFPALFAF